MSWPLGNPTTAYVPDVDDYTKCHECGEWDRCKPDCLTGLREAYAADRIPLDEFEARVGDALGWIAPEGMDEYGSLA